MFIGSSSIRRWTDLNTDMTPRKTINRGYGGAKFTDLAVYIDRIVKPHQFKALVVFVGNDIVGKSDDKSPVEVARLFKASGRMSPTCPSLRSTLPEGG